MTQKNNIPPYGEEQIINQEQLSIQEILAQFQQPIPNNFIPIETEHICSTKSKWDKPLSERYGFTHEGNWIQIDIPHTILEKLELEKGQDITQPLYLDPTVLTRQETYKGITIENEVEIFVQQSFTINNLEKKLIKLFQKIEKLEEQEQLSQETIAEIKKELEETQNLKNTWRNKYLESKWDNNQELQTQTTELIRERDNVQQNLKRNLINFLLKNKQKSKRISELTGGLSFLRGLLVGKNQEVIDLTTQKNDLSREIAEQQRERNRIQAELDNLQTRLGRLQGKFLGSLLRSKKKSEAIKELKAQMVKLRAKLIEKEGQIEDLQNQVDDLNQQLTLADNTIDTLHQELNLKDGEITRLENEVKNLETERDDRPSITLAQWNNDYSKRPTQQRLENIQRELDREKGWWDKWLNDTRVDMQSSANDDKQLPTWVANRHVSFGQLLEWSATLAYGGKGAWLHYRGDQKKGKELIKLISEYYKNQP